MNVSAEQATSTVRFFELALGREPAIARPSTLDQIGLRPDVVRSQMAALAPLAPDQVRRAMARQVRKGSCGRGGLPDYVVKTMYADYLRLKSLAKVAALYGRTRQSVYDTFRNHGLQLFAKRFKKKLLHGGRAYTPDKQGYYRDTIFRAGQHKLLHHVLWIERNGPIPAGHQVFFRDGDKTNFAPENLGCLPIAEVTLYHHHRKIAS